MSDYTSNAIILRIIDFYYFFRFFFYFHSTFPATAARHAQVSTLCIIMRGDQNGAIDEWGWRAKRGGQGVRILNTCRDSQFGVKKSYKVGMKFECHGKVMM